MARPLRIEYEGAIYHVTARGNERRKIYFTATDKEKFLQYIAEAKKKHCILIHCYVLMSNHYHLIIETPKANLSKKRNVVSQALTPYPYFWPERTNAFNCKVWEIIMNSGSTCFVIKLLLMLSVVLCLNFACSKSVMNEKEARQVLKDFYEDNDIPEAFLDRHLVRAGKGIVPYLVVEIQKKDMPKRGYAILALGKISDSRALPALTKLLEDTSESEVMRAEALVSIWYIDRKVGEKLTDEYSGKSKHFDRTIELLRKGKLDSIYKRSFFTRTFGYLWGAW